MLLINFYLLSKKSEQQNKESSATGGMCIQWNLSIAAALGEWHFGCYTEVAVVEF